MNMSTRPFDTYDYVQELIRGGFTQQLAEANMHALIKALDFTIENKLATKEQLQATNEELKKVILKLDSFETRLNGFEAKLDGFESKFATKEELQNAVSRLEKEISKLESFTKEGFYQLEIKIQNLNYKIDQVFLKTIASTGGMITIGCSILGFLIKF